MEDERLGVEKAFVSAILFLSLAFIIALMVILNKSGNLQREKAELERQVGEWQEAAVPAIRARNWSSHLPVVTKLVPRDLREALNPCVPSPASSGSRDGEYDPRACQVVDGSTPFKIELVDKWPGEKVVGWP